MDDLNVVSVAVFGSVARNEDTADSDTDLLIVVENIDKNRIERIEDILRINECFPDESYPLDTILISKTECENNFRNHNPLYLDIAFDAQILYDKNDYLKKHIDETRKYVLLKNIIRKGVGAWSLSCKIQSSDKTF
ncbi:hypothetical protein GF312_13365 [Candidatus Poribacteria bacterium]|nr:hypothetical protein [Candidatus Poribacteria bacterium]